MENEWRPIESAPKEDEELIWLWFPEHGVVKAAWTQGEEEHPEPGWVAYGFEAWGEWIEGEDPTHWLLLPDPPRAE